ncbi:MAG: HlyD family efflux transporter periplasmic adaptor subunit [Rubrivivax sp.]|nr:HlyD family efflux transporter periplasmic adaptor subunit [Rubrivivax sp.]
MTIDAQPARGIGVLVAALLLAACSGEATPPWSGYVEGEFVYVSSPLAGTLTRLAVQRGQTVARGAPLFALDASSERDARDEAAARLATARAQAANTTKGRRSDEIAVTQAQLAQARAQAELADAELARRRALVAQNFISAAQLDDARAAAEQARAHVAELQAALRVAQLPARSDERAAAQATAQAASAALAQAAWREQQKEQNAPADALVSDTFFQVGEWVGAGQPVVALLPPAGTRARFYVAEAEVGAIAPGQRVLIQCSGCGAPIPGRIERVATQPEYTPPVIYSNAQRSRLVFMVEARPDAADGLRLKPGQPVDVRRAPAP